MAAIKALAEQIKAKRTRVAAIFDGKKQPDGTYALTTEDRDEVKSLNAELADLTPKLEQAQADARAAAENDEAIKTLERVCRPGLPLGGDGSGTDRRGAVKSIGEQFLAAPEYKSIMGLAGEKPWAKWGCNLADVDVKTLFQTTAGWDPFVPRGPQVVMSAQQQPKVVDIIPMSETMYAAVKWMLETTYTNNAAETAQAGTYPESAFALTEQSSAVQKIAVTLPITDEQLEDEPRARDYLNNRLTLNLKQRLDSQIVSGDGSAPNLRGLMNVASIGSQAKSTDPAFDAIFKAMTKVQFTGFADPTALILHPTDWQTIRLTRTTEGIYILGYPNEPGPERLWGLPVVRTTYATQGTGITGDFQMYSELVYRRGITFDMTNSHASEFVTGTQRMRGSLRVAFLVTRPTAFCLITGL